MCSRAAILVALSAIVTAQCAECEGSNCDDDRSSMIQTAQAARLFKSTRVTGQQEAAQEAETAFETADEDRFVMLQATTKYEAAEDEEPQVCQGPTCNADVSSMIQTAQAARLFKSPRVTGKQQAAEEAETAFETSDEDRFVMLQATLKYEDAEEASAGVVPSAAMAEFVAMTLFVVIGCGSAMAVAKESGWVLQVALTFGLAITSLAYAVGHYSGGQINCAVTFSLMFAGKLSMAQGMANFAAQMLGSVTGALILCCMFPEEKDKTGGLATNKVADGWSQTNAFIGEFVMTFLLVFTVFETAVNPASKANRELACVAIGFAVFLAHSVLINIDGCSINPTRTFGPALVRKMCYKNSEGAFDDMWVFWAGPIAGAIAAAALSTQMMK